MFSEIPIEKLSETHYAIIEELAVAIDKLGASAELLSVLGSWGDTLPEIEILAMLKELNQLTS